MSTVVPTLVVVGGSIAAVAVMLLRDEKQPATAEAESERVWLDRKLADLTDALARLLRRLGAAVMAWVAARPDRIVAKVDRRADRAERRSEKRHHRSVERAERRETKALRRAEERAAVSAVEQPTAPATPVSGVDPRLTELVDDGALAVAEWVEPGDPVAPRPGFLRRVRASLGLIVVILAIGVALTLLFAVSAALIARSLESAVN